MLEGSSTKVGATQAGPNAASQARASHARAAQAGDGSVAASGQGLELSGGARRKQRKLRRSRKVSARNLKANVIPDLVDHDFRNFFISKIESVFSTKCFAALG